MIFCFSDKFVVHIPYIQCAYFYSTFQYPAIFVWASASELESYENFINVSFVGLMYCHNYFVMYKASQVQCIVLYLTKLTVLLIYIVV